MEIERFRQSENDVQSFNFFINNIITEQQNYN